MHDDDQPQAPRIGDDVAVASLDLLMRVEAGRAAGFGRLDAPGVDDGRTRLGELAGTDADFLA